MSNKIIDTFSGEYEFLSNFYKSPLVFEGIEYPTVEHAFQASKTKDIEARISISKLETPGKAKRAGRNLVLRSDWEDIKVTTMLILLRKKFSKYELGKKLFLTGDATLMEGNFHGDRFWGCVMEGTEWVGTNMLGKLLMQVREENRYIEQESFTK